MFGYFTVIITTMLPIAELRGGIPIGLALGLNPFHVFLIAAVTNIFIFFPIFLGLKFFYSKFFSKISIIRERIEGTRKRGKPYIDRYGTWGLILFVGIPLPMTGVWTGTMLAWLLGLDWKKSFIAVCLGVLISATIVTAVSIGVLNGLKFMV